MKRLKALGWVGVFSLGLLGGMSCHQKQAEGKPPVSVSVAEAQSRSVAEYLDEIGHCVALEVVEITTQVSGQITAIHFMDGQEVKPGDALFTIDPRPYQAALDQALAMLAKDKAAFELNELELERSRDLVPQDFLSPQDFDSLKTKVTMSLAQVAEDQAAVETAKIDLEYCSIVSPIQGKTGMRQVDVGNVVSPSEQEVLLTIQRMDPMYVDFTVTEGELNRVRRLESAQNLQVVVSFPEDLTTKREGKLFFVDNTVKPSTGTVKLRALISNEDRLFWPGQFVKVRVILRQLPQAILVPSGAVGISQEGPYVFVAQGKKAEKRLVHLGQRHGDEVVITQGIEVGEKVVVTGQMMLGPGAEIVMRSPGDSQKQGEEASSPKLEQKASEAKVRLEDPIEKRTLSSQGQENLLVNPAKPSS